MPKRASTPEDDELDDLIEQTRNLMMQKISSSSGTDDFEGLTTFPVNITTLAKLTKAGEPSWDFVPLMVDAIDNERIPMKMIMRALIGFDDIGKQFSQSRTEGLLTNAIQRSSLLARRHSWPFSSVMAKVRDTRYTN